LSSSAAILSQTPKVDSPKKREASADVRHRTPDNRGIVK
jgi:hypothetical protein